MDLYFCDLCNESIPQVDLEQGKAVRRNERLICSACEAAMTGGHERPAVGGAPESGPAATHIRPLPIPASSGSSPLVAVGLAFSAVALVVAAGAGAYLYSQLEDRTAEMKQGLADLERAAPEHARTVSAALVTEVHERETELAAARFELEMLSARVIELEKANERGAAVPGRLDKLEERMESLADLASRVEHQAGALDELSNRVAGLAATSARANETKKPETPAAPAAQAPASPAAAAPGGALWQNWVADLASPNSNTRWQALQSLGATGDPGVLPHLVPMLKDADIFVRMAASRILGNLGAVEAIPALIDTLEDEEASVREAALVSLRGLSGQSIPFDPAARDGDRAKRVKAWRDWWAEASKELLGQGGAGKKARG